jgi:hypothetical protein
MITCTHCETMFKKAHECSSKIFERNEKKYLISSYGSKFYGNLYEVLTDKYVSGIICDACITDNKQDFKLLRDNQYFGIDL